jgi:DNA-binding MarR family transcriptional regulator
VNQDGPPPEPLASAPGFLLSWAGRRMATEFAHDLEPLGIQPREFGVLNLIDAHPGITQHELGAGALVDPSSMVALLDELEQRGWAERRPHPSDRRKRAVHLTPAGKRLLNRARAVGGKSVADLLAPLSASEVSELRRLLRKIARVED